MASIPRERAVLPDTGRQAAGIALMLVAVSILPVMDGFAKHLGQSLPVLQVVWGRFFFNVILVLPVLAALHGRKGLIPPRPGIQIIRGLCLVTATTLFFSALTFLPIADTLAIFFIQPLIVTALSPFVLGEHVGVRRWSAVIVGFIGTLIIIRPGFQEINLGTVLALAAGLCFASYLLLTRRIAGTGRPLVTATFTGLAGAIVLTVAMPWVWQWPTATQWLELVLIGLISTLGHYCIVKAYEHTEATVLAPFSFAEILMAVLVGYAWFGDLPDRWTVVGVVILVASGIYISFREGRRRTVPHP